MAKKLYITTAIPYVNALPHIGNALDYLIADIWTRYQIQNGREVRFQVGTDEHGNKVASKAAELGIDTQEYADNMYLNFEALMRKTGAEFTDFIRTTEQHHKEAVQYIWKKLQPYIYKGSYEGWYCMGHEAFFTDKEVQLTGGICSDHQKPYEHISEENYYLKASFFTEKIRQAIETKKMEIVPEFRSKEFLEMIKNGLQDVSISRPRKSLSWGVSVPDDPDQVMYVWLDALTNYITVLGYPDNDSWRDFWPADIQVIGKDILRFHAGLWPAILLGLDLPLPKKLLVHGFINIDGAKISKTVGNVIDPGQIIDEYGVDAFRYFFSRHIPTQDDGDFTWENFENAYNSELANDLGNLVQRVVSMVLRYQAGISDGGLRRGEHDTKVYHDAMRSLNFNLAVDEVWRMIRGLNQYIEEVKPWAIAKTKDENPDAQAHLSEVLSHIVSNLLQIADLLVPFLPTTAASIHEQLGSDMVQQSNTVLFPKIYKHTIDPKLASSAK